MAWLTLLALFGLPVVIVVGLALVVLALNGLRIDGYPNPDSR